MKRLIFILLLVASLFIPTQVMADSLAAQKVVDERVCTNVAKALPQTTQGALFTISGGPIEVLSLTGEVTTVIGTTATVVTLRADPTTPSTDTDLTTGANIGDDAEGTMYSLVTSVATAMAVYTNGVGPTMGGVFSVIVPVGAIDLETAASVTGNITWRLRYRPLHNGVKVVAN